MVLDKKLMEKNNFGRIFSGFVKTIHVELPDKTIKVAVPKILG